MIGTAVILADPIFQGLAISLLFGLVSSTPLTALVIPATADRCQLVMRISKRGLGALLLPPRRQRYRLQRGAGAFGKKKGAHERPDPGIAMRCRPKVYRIDMHQRSGQPRQLTILI